MLLTDSHCHIDFECFSNNFSPLLTQCYNKGIHRIIVPSVSPSNWQQVLNLHTLSIQQHKSCQLFPCLGIHPWFLNDLNEQSLFELNKEVSAHSHHIIAIGETGIDQVIAEKHNNLHKQITFFDYQLSLAEQFHLPIIIHHRRSHDKILPLLKKYRLSTGGVIHAFSGSYQQAKNYIDLGFKLGIGGTITYERAQKTINTVKKLPLESLLLETDAPSMPLQGFQGEDNSPLHLINVLNALNEIRPEKIEAIAHAIECNVQQLFFDRRSEPLTTKTV